MTKADNKIDNLLEDPRFYRWSPAAVLRIFGEDSFAFLQGQLTNDLRNLPGDGSVYGLWLNHKGRVLADGFVVSSAAPAEFWIVSYFSLGPQIRERLEAFIVADDVVIEDLSGRWAGVALLGLPGGGFPQTPATRVGFGFVGRRALQPSSEWVYPVTSENERAVAAALAGRSELSAVEMEQLRIAAKIPVVPIDIGPGELPNEGGLDETAISYTKGCYLGQEVMARLKTMGQVRRRLLRVRGNGAIPSLPAALYDGERRVGELRSAVVNAEGFVGLALLTLLHLQPDRALRFSVHAEESAVRLIDLA